MQTLRPEVFLQAAAASPRLSLAELLRLHGDESAAVVLLVVSVLCVVPIYGMGTALSLAIFAMAWHWRHVARTDATDTPASEPGGPRWLPSRLAQATLDEVWSRRCLHGLAWLYGQAGRRLRERMRSIAVHVADRPEGNTCREIILGLYGMNDDYFGGVGVKRQEPVKLDWPIESGASKKQLQRQREILKRLRVWDEVRCAIVLVFVSMHWK